MNILIICPPGMPTNKNQPNTGNSSKIPHTIIKLPHRVARIFLNKFKWAKSSMSTKPAITAYHCHPHDSKACPSRAPGSTCLLTLDKSTPDTLGTSRSKWPSAMLLWCETLGILNTKTWITKSALYSYYIYMSKEYENHKIPNFMYMWYVILQLTNLSYRSFLMLTYGNGMKWRPSEFRTRISP